ncbi:MAG TPA: hypothetical protein VFE60_02445 [Roseiarcus sp.]|jgi:predicted nucleotide-binding protein|nr:hypothetical protein [Roseiarcus sp.]
MDDLKHTDPGNRDQQLGRRRATREFEDALDRARDNLAFEMGGVLGAAINEATGDDPSASANAFFTATQTIKHVVLEHDRVIRLALRALLREFAL